MIFPFTFTIISFVPLTFNYINQTLTIKVKFQCTWAFLSFHITGIYRDGRKRYTINWLKLYVMNSYNWKWQTQIEILVKIQFYESNVKI